MNGEEFGEELYRENLYFVYEDKCRELEKELDKFRPFTSAYEMKKEIKRLNNVINEINSIVEYWGYDKEHNDISSFRMAMKNIKDVLGSDKE